EAEGASGERYGPTRVASTVGRQPLCRLGPTTSPQTVAGCVVTETGRPIPGATVILRELRSPDVSRDRTPVWWERTSDVEGGFSFDHVEEGPAELICSAANFTVEAKTILIDGALEAMRLVLLQQEQVVLKHKMLARTPCDGPSALLLATLKAAGGCSRSWVTYGNVPRPDPWNPGCYRMAATILDVPAGQYELRELADGTRGAVPWHEPLVWEAIAPATVEHIESDAARVLHRFRVTDLVTGRALPEARYRFGPSGALFDGGPVPVDPAAGWRVPPGTPLRWFVQAAGYAPVWGDESGFEDSPDGKLAEVRLGRGWGAQFLLRAGDPVQYVRSRPREWPGWNIENSSDFLGALACAPIPGVRVEVDGETHAVSDSEGTVRVSLPSRPSRVSLFCEGWRLVAVEPVSPHWNPGSPLFGSYVLWMSSDSPSPALKPIAPRRGDHDESNDR
ncbi:MAG: carboxypeptidase regulatory-like domain-containing protein, partial [Acidimicrobiales bacterium]|nr:carboxypeptidase regulatory-like domain-containing protein [Acidimicrobiales bacterium]